MRIRPERQSEYDEYVAKNDDPYGSGVVRYERRWAEAMEEHIPEHADTALVKTMIDVHADELSHTADTEGITGFMYGCAVRSLAYHWVHGEELRQWHNVKTQIHDEGEAANREGGVLNPAILEIRD